MKLYLPKGSEMTEPEEQEWIAKVERLTSSFHGNRDFTRYAYETASYLRMRQNSNYKEFITDMWQEHYDRAEELFLSNKKNLLQNDLLRYSFFLTGGGVWQDVQIPYLETKWAETELRELLIEDHVFMPDITSHKYWSSETLINHLTHLTVFQEKTRAEIKSFDKIIEVGGGYGSMCRLLKRICGRVTYICVDLPVFLFIQACYLRNVFGHDSVNIIVGDTDRIQEGKINLIDISNEAGLKSIGTRPDLFIATWSLSEANQRTQELIYGLVYFGAKYLLIGYRHYDTPNPRQPFSDCIKLAPNYKSIYDGSAFFALSREQFYLFARRMELSRSQRLLD